MLFEVVDFYKNTIMHCSDWCCVPAENTLYSMYQAGYRFKINGKKVTIKKIIELRKEYTNGNND